MKNQDLIEFGANLARFIPTLNGYTAGVLGKGLMRLAKRHQNLAIALCNGWVEQDEYDRKTERIEEKMRDLLPAGKVVFQGDPRGATSRRKFLRPNAKSAGDDFTVFIPTT